MWIGGNDNRIELENTGTEFDTKLTGDKDEKVYDKNGVRRSLRQADRSTKTPISEIQ